MIFIENKLNLKNHQDIYYLKHFLNFFTFYISSIIFFYVIKSRFKNNFLALIASLFYISAPRIFAESFYNCKDIIFMSLTVFAIFFALKVLKKTNIKNIILFSFFCALATSVRPLGIFILFLLFAFLIFESLEEGNIYKKFNFILISLFFYILFTYLLWPYLWLDPLNNFIFSLKSFSHYGWGGSTLYFGDYVKSQSLPWHYTFVWIAITTPLIYSLLFIVGSYKVFSNFFTNLEKLWKNLNEKLDLFILSFFFAPIFLVIILNSTLYDGWRHLYFIYPSLIYISIFGLNYILNLNSKKFFKNSFFIIVFISIFINIFNIIKFHPFQNVYFNFLVEKKVNSLFNVDYWGLGNAHSILKILDDANNSENINIRTASFTPLNYSKYIINNEKMKNINFTGTAGINSEYIFTNHIYEGNPKYKKKYFIPNNYKKIYSLKRGNIVINEIYKKNNQ